MTDLTTYGSGVGLKIWSLNPVIQGLTDDEADRMVRRARVWIMTQGEFCTSLPLFGQIMTDALYHAAEGIYFQSQAIQPIVTPFRSERIGGYQYDKGSQSTTTDTKPLDELIPVLGSLIEYLRCSDGPWIRTIRLFETPPADPRTGIIEYVHSIETDRISRWINDGYNRSPEDYRDFVYGSHWGY